MATSTIFAALSLLVIAAATMVFGIGFFPEESYKGPIPERGYLMNKRHQLIATSPAYRVLNKILLVFAYWSEKIPMGNFRKGLSMRLARSGYMGGFTADEFLAFCVVAAIFFFSLAFFFMTSVTGESRIPLCFVAAMFGTYFPIMYLDERVMQRLTQINRDLPYMLDVLALSVGAGLDFNSSLERIVTKDSTRSPLID